MYLMYVDESGDPGISNSPTRYFILSAIIIHELRWRTLLDAQIIFRRYLKKIKGLKLREEIHCTALLNNPGELVRIKRHERVDIIRQSIHWLSAQQDLNIITVCVDKHANLTKDIFELAWTLLIQRFENTLRNKNFSGPANPDERGMLLPDNTDGLKLTTLLRKMRRFNVVPNHRSYFQDGSRNLTLDYIIEDPFLKDSAKSYFHQMCDVVAYCARQLYEPNAYMNKKGGKNLYLQLLPVLVTKASTKNILGIVEV